MYEAFARHVPESLKDSLNVADSNRIGWVSDMDFDGHFAFLPVFWMESAIWRHACGRTERTRAGPPAGWGTTPSELEPTLVDVTSNCSFASFDASEEPPGVYLKAPIFTATNRECAFDATVPLLGEGGEGRKRRGGGARGG